MLEKNKRFTAFKSADLAAWEVAAREELKGAYPQEKTHPGDGWSIHPYYDRNAVIPTAPLLRASENNFLGPRTWYNCPSLLVTDPTETNRLALECLGQGADGIFFELDHDVNLEILLKDIEWSYCSLNFLARKNQDAIATSLKNFIIKNQYNLKPIQGALFGRLPSNHALAGAFHFAGYQVPSCTSPVEEIAAAFTWLAKTDLNNFSEKAGQVAFSVTLGTDFFLELAKLRAYRLTWINFLAATHSRSDVPLFIHARSLPWTEAPFEPHANMLKGTTVAMAAILGGCDAMTIDPEKNDDKMMSRVSRNISNLLREESYFSKVADPVAGSYFLENLTLQLTESAWKIIQTHLPS